VQEQKVANIDLQIYANRDPDQFLHPNIPGVAGPETLPTGQLDAVGTIKTMGAEFANNLK
jgi:hypothetical protein